MSTFNKFVKEMDTSAMVDARAISLGFKCIGSGKFASVYTKDDINYVIKVVTYPDYGYSTFIQKVMGLEKNNPWFPEIYNIQYPNGEHMPVICMEKLFNHDSVIKNKYTDCPKDIFELSFYSVARQIEILTYALIDDEPEEVKEALKGMYNKKQLIKAATLIEKIITNSNNPVDLFLDMHVRNFAIRKKHNRWQPVIIDPIATSTTF